MRQTDVPQVVIVGAGEVTASFWLPGVAELGWPVAIVDVMAERAEKVAAAAGPRVRASGSLAEAGPGERDVLIVATPPGAHAAVTREALAAGARRLIIEKPPLVSMADLDDTLAALRQHGAAARSAWIRRAWIPIAEARGLFPVWRESFGRLERVRISEGRPYGWASRATAERGTEGLSSIFLDELPHALDALFSITGWKDAAPVERRVEQLGPLDVDVSVTLDADGERVELDIRGSRTALLANSLDLGFAGGTVSIDMQPKGGILVRKHSADRVLIACDSGPDVMEPMFADLLTAAATEPIESWTDELETWRGPLRIIEQFEGEA